jgi:hypothetical protein
MCEVSGKSLFAKDVTYTALSAMRNSGGSIKVTKLAESFNFDNLREVHGADLIPLFAIDPRENIQVFNQEESIEPDAGWSVISLVPKAS